MVDCATDETKTLISPSAKQRRNPCSGPSPVYQDLSTRHDWPVGKVIVDLPIRMKENSKRTSRTGKLSLLRYCGGNFSKSLLMAT